MSRAGETAREAAVGIVRTLRQAGHVAYLAGGCVRDVLLGGRPKDWDVATDAPPQVVLRLFRGSKAVGEAFGVVLVYTGGRGPRRRIQTEVATFRLEWGYTDGRRPDGVAFTDACHDAQRRDFTINGLFADPLDGGAHDHAHHDDLASARTTHIPGLGLVIDYVGGLADLEAKRIRAIGDPDERFGEDYLRMLRAVRFAARLGFEIEPRTAAAIRPLAKYLGQISRERIGQELRLTLEHPARAQAAALIQSLRLDSAVLNEDHLECDCPTLAALPHQMPDELTAATLPLALAAWMLDRHAAQPSSLSAAATWLSHGMMRTLDRWRKALCLSNDDRDAINAMLRLISELNHWPDLPTARRKRLMASSAWASTMTLLRAIEPAAADRIAADAAPLADDGIGIAPPPLLTGDDLIAMGLSPSPAFKRLLDGIYDAQLEGAIRTREQAAGWIQEQGQNQS